jgi:hypothetical protein
MNFPIIQYANDNLIVLQSNEAQLNSRKDLLQNFASSSDLKVNYSKSVIVSINSHIDKIALFANNLGCTNGSFPFTYLGMRLGLTKPSVKDFLPLVKKCKRRLLVTSNLLTQGGKLILVNSVLTSLPTLLGAP